MPPSNARWCLKGGRNNRMNSAAHLAAGGCTQAVQGSYSIPVTFAGARSPAFALEVDVLDMWVWDGMRMSAELEALLKTRLSVKL
jgi:hypothetical protein